jgi:hypothetical protein
VELLRAERESLVSAPLVPHAARRLLRARGAAARWCRDACARAAAHAPLAPHDVAACCQALGMTPGDGLAGLRRRFVGREGPGKDGDDEVVEVVVLDDSDDDAQRVHVPSDDEQPPPAVAGREPEESACLGGGFGAGRAVEVKVEGGGG